MSILQWITDNQTLLLALLVFGSRIWSHYEHRSTEKRVNETNEKVAAIVNGKSQAGTHDDH